MKGSDLDLYLYISELPMTVGRLIFRSIDFVGTPNRVRIPMEPATAPRLRSSGAPTC